MYAARENLQGILAPAAATIAAEVPSFEGFILAQQDVYHPDSAGALAQFNAPQVNKDRLAFQTANVTGRRIDLSVSALGQTFTDGKYQLEQSRMNPEQHLVAGIHVPEAVGKRAASVFQMAFTKELGAPTPEQLDHIYQYWKALEPDCLPQLETLHQEAESYPNRSVADALLLDVPTTPNAFLIGWDTSGSRTQAAENYPELRDDLTLRGQRMADIMHDHNGIVLRPTGDGQMMALEIPSPEYDRLSDVSIAQFATKALIPLVRDILADFKADGRPPVRVTVDLGRIEPTTFDKSSPTIFEMADASDKQPHDYTTVAFGRRAIEVLALTESQIDTLNA